MPDEALAGFWYFVIDGPHPNNEHNIEIIAILSKTFGDTNKQVLLLSQQFDSVKQDEKH